MISRILSRQKGSKLAPFFSTYLNKPIFFRFPFSTSKDSQLNTMKFSKTKNNSKSILLKSKQIFKEYRVLSKFNLSILNVVAVLGGYFFCGGGSLGTSKLIALTIGSFLSAASSSSANQIIEAKNDRLMQRTNRRPLPKKAISLNNAKIFCVSSGVLGVGSLYYLTNPLTAGLSLLTILSYALVYTPMKKKHHTNVYIGAIVGSIPPVMGCTAALGSFWNPSSLLVFCLLYFWQVSHFMPIAWLNYDDYKKAGNRVVDNTKKRILSIGGINVAILGILPLVSTAIGLTNPLFILTGSLSNLIIWLPYWKFAKSERRVDGIDTLKGGFFHLLAFFILLFLHRKLPEEDSYEIFNGNNCSDCFEREILINELN